ncbi:hrp65 protein-like [Pollicipes pollicipes]|uniref:hrp65 protein-like n=1 Tax=Pollicipes pollicipes TaxID=41117 RepID=UPI001884A84A|nr:hrp65 protein-like [Pollicipes pollicipes]
MPGSFEMEYGNRWKQLYEMEKQRREQLEQEIKKEMDKLRDEMEFARREHETEMLLEQLRRREMEQERSKGDLDVRQQQREEERRRLQEEMQRCRETLRSRMRQSEEDVKQRQQENQLFMQADELSSLLDQQEQAIWDDGSAAPPAVLDTGYGDIWGGQDAGFSRHGVPPPGMGGHGGRGGRGAAQVAGMDMLPVLDAVYWYSVTPMDDVSTGGGSGRSPEEEEGVYMGEEREGTPAEEPSSSRRLVRPRVCDLCDER